MAAIINSTNKLVIPPYLNFNSSKEEIERNEIEDRITNIIGEYLDAFDHSPEKIARWFKISQQPIGEVFPILAKFIPPTLSWLLPSFPSPQINSDAFNEDLNTILTIELAAKALNFNFSRITANNLASIQSKKFNLFVSIPPGHFQMIKKCLPTKSKTADSTWVDSLYLRNPKRDTVIRTPKAKTLKEFVKGTPIEARLNKLICDVPDYNIMAKPRVFSIYHTISIIPQEKREEGNAIISLNSKTKTAANTFSFLGRSSVAVVRA